VLGAQSIKLGESKIVVCGGAENMSNAPLSVDGNNARWGVKLGGGMQLRDALWRDGLTDTHAGTPMGVTAENLAKKYNISREVSDCVCQRKMSNIWFLSTQFLEHISRLTVFYYCGTAFWFSLTIII
jgi:acetyl-CoA acetyltransferase